MKHKFYLSLILIFLALMFLLSCENSVDSNTLGGDNASNSGEWLIPKNQVYDGGPGKDGIPAVSNPQFIDASQADYLENNDLVIGFKEGNEVRVYPHIILDWHEIVNDKIGNKNFSITYCPLTGSGICWNRELEGNVTTFGVSGLLYNNNLIPYDRATDSNWSQMKLISVAGKHKGSEVETFPIIETRWDYFKKLYPNAKVLSLNTGFSKPYGNYPYGDYRTNHNKLLFPITHDDARLPRKERILGILVGNNATAIRFNLFSDGIAALNINFNDTPLVVVGSRKDNFIISFYRQLPDGTILEFEAIDQNGSKILKDMEGNTWNIFGEAVSGPRMGEQLSHTKSFIAYWFAWAAFYPNTEIYANSDRD